MRNSHIVVHFNHLLLVFFDHLRAMSSVESTDSAGSIDAWLVWHVSTYHGREMSRISRNALACFVSKESAIKYVTQNRLNGEYAEFDRNRHNRIGKIELYIMTNIPPRTKTEIHYEITHVPKL
jgi:hypothetical protein